jgi:WxL interacting protein linking bacterial and host surfaces
MVNNYRSLVGWRSQVYRLAVTCGCAFAFAVLLGSVLPTSVARADTGTPQFSIRPVAANSTASSTAPYFIFDAQPGTTIQSKVRITNIGTASGSVALYGVDATTGQTSGVVYRSNTDPRTDVGAWVSVGTQRVTLAPKQDQILPFTITVPASVRPGQHVGGLVAEDLTVQTGSSSSGMQVNIQHLSIVAVQVNLPGSQAERMEATGIQAGGQHNYQILFLGLHNTGAQMLKPTGALHVMDTTGHQLKLMNLTLDTVLPQTAIDYPVYVDGQALGPGHYKGVVSLTYGTPQQTLSRAFDFEVTAASLQQIFGSKTPNTPPSLLAGAGPGGILVILAVVGGAALLLLAGLGACVVFVPGLRERLRVPFRRR